MLPSHSKSEFCNLIGAPWNLDEFKWRHSTEITQPLVHAKEVHKGKEKLIKIKSCFDKFLKKKRADYFEVWTNQSWLVVSIQTPQQLLILLRDALLCC